MLALTSDCDHPARFECNHRSSCSVFDVKLAQDMFDVLADGAGLCAENGTDVLVGLAL